MLSLNDVLIHYIHHHSPCLNPVFECLMFARVVHVHMDVVHSNPLAPHIVEGLSRGERWIDRELVWWVVKKFLAVSMHFFSHILTCSHVLHRWWKAFGSLLEGLSLRGVGTGNVQNLGVDRRRPEAMRSAFRLGKPKEQGWGRKCPEQVA